MTCEYKYKELIVSLKNKLNASERGLVASIVKLDDRKITIKDLGKNNKIIFLDFFASIF